MSKLFDVDPVTKTVQWFHWDEASRGKEMVIQTRQEMGEIFESNKLDINNAESRWGDGKCVARLPLTIWADLKKKGVIDDQKALRRFLNDPDNRVFRTFPGRI